MFQLANAFMRLQAGFLADTASNPNTESTVDLSWVTKITSAINTILTPILAIVAAAGMIWAVVLGVQMARADSTEKREEAKKRLIGLIVGIVILVVLILFFTLLFPEILKATTNSKIDIDQYK